MLAASEAPLGTKASPSTGSTDQGPQIVLNANFRLGGS